MGCSVPCDDLEGWDGGGGREGKEGGYAGNTETIHFVVQQKLTQHCKAVILQVKKKKRKEIYCSKSFFSLDGGKDIKMTLKMK